MKENILNIIRQELKKGNEGCLINTNKKETEALKYTHGAVEKYVEEMLEEEFGKRYYVTINPIPFETRVEFHEVS